MPGCVHEKLQSFVKETYLEQRQDKFMQTYPWIVIREKDWDAIQGYAKPIVSTELYDIPCLPWGKHSIW